MFFKIIRINITITFYNWQLIAKQYTLNPNVIILVSTGGTDECGENPV